MAPIGNRALESFCLLFLCSIALAEVHRVSYHQLISPQGAPGLPRRLSVHKTNDLVLSTYDSSHGRLTPRNGYIPGDQDSQTFWRAGGAECLNWGSWVETEYQSLVREVNASSSKTEPYYLQILQTCELDDATSTIQAVTRYSLNGEDMLQHQADQNRWFSIHPAAWRMAKRWNQRDTPLSHITPQYCKFWIKNYAPFTAQKTAQPTAYVALIPGTQDRPPRFVCQVTGFYPRNIEVTWEWEGRVAQGEQVTSGIWPNGDATFQVRVSIEIEQEGVSATEHVCIVRHSSLGDAPLRVTWVAQATDLMRVLVIVAGGIITVLIIGALGWCWRRRQGDQMVLYCEAQTQPGTLDSASDTAQSAEDTSSTAPSCSNASE